MREWRDQAIILRLGLFREADLWLRMLCREHGLFTVFAFGGAKSRKRFCGCLDVLNSLECRIKVTREGSFLNLQEASLLEGTRELRDNCQNLGMAANCVRFMDALSIGPESGGECYETLENLRSCLESAQHPHRLMPLFFRLRIAAALGFAPDFGICGGCGRPITAEGLFLTDEGRVFCSPCASSKRPGAKKYAIHASRASLEALESAQHKQPQQWLGFTLSTRQAGVCARIIDAFVQYHLGIAWDNGFFRHV